MRTFLLGFLSFCIAVNLSWAIEDHHSYSAHQEKLFKSAEMDFDLDFSKKELSGVVKYTIESYASKQVVLDTHSLNIKKVEQLMGSIWQNIDSFSLSKVDEKYGQALTIPIAPETTAVRITYSTTSSESKGYQWVNPEQTKSKAPFFFTSSQPINARRWIPCPDTPSIRIPYIGHCSSSSGSDGGDVRFQYGHP